MRAGLSRRTHTQTHTHTDTCRQPVTVLSTPLQVLRCLYSVWYMHPSIHTQRTHTHIHTRPVHACPQVLRGLYSVWLEVWLRFFPKKSLLVIPSEELFEHPTAVIQKVIAHAGLPSVTKAQIQGWFKDLTIPR